MGKGFVLPLHVVFCSLSLLSSLAAFLCVLFFNVVTFDFFIIFFGASSISIFCVVTEGIKKHLIRHNHLF